MANAITGNKIYVDSVGSAADTRIKIAYILFTPDSSNDELVLRESSSGANAIYIRGATAKQTTLYDFSNAPLVFTNGLYIQTITSNAKAVLVTVMGG